MTPQNKKTIVSLIIIIATFLVGYLIISSNKREVVREVPLDSTPQNVVLSGRFTCLPHTDTTGPQTEECVFGLQTDDEVYYAVNFGESGDAMSKFQNGQYISAEGFVVIKEALSSDHWAEYDIKGVFSITKMLDQAQVSGKLNINVACESALAYMSFPNDGSAEIFLEECKEGKYPEVIERYKADMGLGDGAAI